ncbi:peptidase S8/S53 domain-containing protein [Flagelloscypha sp. PMI_526]|nr:peptidase S8/S53 domain-containing protein [Flagelloscypha sp. PMI_526]
MLFWSPCALLVFHSFLSGCSASPSLRRNRSNSLVRDDAPWHLAAISSRTPVGAATPLTSDWEEPGKPDQPGKDVIVYLIDTGVERNHPDLANLNTADGLEELKAPSIGKDADPSGDDYPEDGHGTSIAALIAGKDLGFAPFAKLVSIKICNKDTCNDLSGTGIVRFQRANAEALRMVIKDWGTRDPKPKHGIINISQLLSYAKSGPGAEVPGLIEEATNLGLLVINSAGNQGSNSCYEDVRGRSPIPGSTRIKKGREIIVGATNEFNEIASFSNRGSCIDFWAPGTRLTSASLKSPTGRTLWDGTSQAAGIITGLLAVAVTSPDFDGGDNSRDYWKNLLIRPHLNVVEPLLSIREGAGVYLAKNPTMPLISLNPAFDLNSQNVFHMYSGIRKNSPW